MTPVFSTPSKQQWSKSPSWFVAIISMFQPITFKLKSINFSNYSDEAGLTPAPTLQISDSIYAVTTANFTNVLTTATLCKGIASSLPDIVSLDRAGRNVVRKKCSLIIAMFVPAYGIECAINCFLEAKNHCFSKHFLKNPALDLANVLVVYIQRMLLAMSATFFHHILCDKTQ